MFKVFGLRITPFFLFILGLQSLALLLSLYIGLLLYQDSISIEASAEVIEHLLYTGLFLIFLLSILTPGFFHETRVITYMKKTFHEKTLSFVVAAIVMIIILFFNSTGLDARFLFVAALISASIGIIVGQFGLLGKYWRFLIHSGMN